MPPKTRLCLCGSHGCADVDRISTLTGEVLKGRYLGQSEFYAHQRDEKNAKRSKHHDHIPPSSVESPSNTGQSIHTPSPSLGSPPLPAAHNSAVAGTYYGVLPGPLANVEGQQPTYDDEGDCPRMPNSTAQTDATTSTPDHTIMQAIERCRLDLQLRQRADISCDQLVFEETSTGEPRPHLVDGMSNTQFLGYEATMLGLLGQVDQINTGGHEEYEVAKQNVSSRIKDELDRLRTLKHLAWKNRMAGFFGTTSSSPFRVVDTGTQGTYVLFPFGL
jgi:hypothetical protein